MRLDPHDGLMVKLSGLLLVVLCLPVCCLADVPEEQRAEVAHLITFVTNSPCRLERNGRWYTGRDAAAHMQRKYEYFRETIKSTEDFIRFSATYSTWSGKAYHVHCDGEETEPSGQWLVRELTRYRHTRTLRPSSP